MVHGAGRCHAVPRHHPSKQKQNSYFSFSFIGTFERIDQVLQMDFAEKAPQVIDVHQHVKGFHYVVNAKKNSEQACGCAEPVKRSIIWNDPYLIISNDTGCHLSLVGTGYGHSLTGLVYNRTGQCLGPSFYTQVQGTLFQRPLAYDKCLEKFGHTLTVRENFHVSKEFSLATNLQIGNVKTTSLLSLNNDLLWIRQVYCSDPELALLLPQTAHISILDFCVIESDHLHLKRRLVLLKSPESAETMVKIHKLLSSGKSDEDIKPDGNSTSCGLKLTTLQECTYTVSDQFLTILAPNVDRGTKSKSLGTAYSYNLGESTKTLEVFQLKDSFFFI